MLDKKKFPITNKVISAVKDFKKGFKSNFYVTTGRTSIKVENGKAWINGKKVSLDEAFKKMSEGGVHINISNGDLNVSHSKNKPKARKVPSGSTQRISGDVLGNLTLQGDNITVIIEGDCMGNINGATTVNVEGDMMGNY